MLVYNCVPFIVSNHFFLFWVSNDHNSLTVQNRTHVCMNFFDHKNLGNHLLQLCPKVVKHPVYIHIYIKQHSWSTILRNSADTKDISKFVCDHSAERPISRSLSLSISPSVRFWGPPVLMKCLEISPRFSSTLTLNSLTKICQFFF